MQNGKPVIIGKVSKEDYASGNFDAAKEILYKWMLTQATPAPAPPVPAITKPAATVVKPTEIITEKKETYSEKLKRLQKERGG
jgi:hypothetical protein